MTTAAVFWNNIAEEYSRKPVENPDAFDRKIAITQSRMRATDTVLDIGCGTGSLALRLAPHAAQVHGLDIADEMIRIANGKAREQSVDNVTFHTGVFDAGFTEFDAGTLDGVCAYSFLHLVEDRADALSRIYRMLKPGGFFVSSTVCLRESWAPYRPLLTVMRWLGKAPMVKVLPKVTVVEEIRRAGFVDVEQPDVSGSALVAFVVATKPATES